jgi:hypothetical protein
MMQIYFCRPIERFEARGVEARFPLLDLTDAATVPVNALWTRDFDQIRQGSTRYGSEHSLVGRWIDLSDGSKLVDWYYLGPDGEVHKQMRLSNLDGIWDVGCRSCRRCYARLFSGDTAAV